MLFNGVRGKLSQVERRNLYQFPEGDKRRYTHLTHDKACALDRVDESFDTVELRDYEALLDVGLVD